jgi:hypothetical protein
MAFHRWGKVCRPRPRAWAGWGPKVRQAKALPGFAGVGNVGTFGVDPLDEGVDVAAWGPPWRSWSPSSWSLLQVCGGFHSLRVEFHTSSLGGY